MLTLSYSPEEDNDEEDAREVHQGDTTHCAEDPVGRGEQQHSSQEHDQVDVGNSRYLPNSANRGANWAANGHRRAPRHAASIPRDPSAITVIGVDYPLPGGSNHMFAPDLSRIGFAQHGYRERAGRTSAPAERRFK
jgi:hypothetical protein